MKLDLLDIILILVMVGALATPVVLLMSDMAEKCSH
jgi:hypothetical protein